MFDETTSVTGDEDTSSALAQLEAELSSSQVLCERLEKENTELRRSLRKSVSESALGRELEALTADRERMLLLISKLKTEKSHLVETVLNLSNEVDEANRVRLDDQLKFKQEVLKHSEADKAIRSSKYRMGMQVVELLKLRGVDVMVVQEVQMHVTNSCVIATEGILINNLKVPPPPAAAGSSSSSSAAQNNNYDTEGEDDQLSGGGEGGGGGGGGGGSGGGGRARSSSRASSSGRRSRQGSKSPGGRRRRNEPLDRDETESMISSVSTHRSGRSSNSPATTRSTSRGHGRRQKAERSTPITAETLAALDRRNGNNSDRIMSDEGGVRAPSPEYTKKTAEEPSWWGRLF